MFHLPASRSETRPMSARRPASGLSRRQFLATSAAATIASGYFITTAPAAQSKSPNEKLNLLCVGVANKGWDNVMQLRSENIVALCDVDANYLAKAAETFPQARQHRDFRKAIEAEQKNIDAV